MFLRSKISSSIPQVPLYRLFAAVSLFSVLSFSNVIYSQSKTKKIQNISEFKSYVKQKDSLELLPSKTDLQRREYMTKLKDIGAWYQEAGDFQQALSCYQKVETTALSVSDQYMYFKAVNNTAVVYSDNLKNYPKALSLRDHLLETLSKEKILSDEYKISKILYLLNSVDALFSMKQYEEGKKLLDQVSPLLVDVNYPDGQMIYSFRMGSYLRAAKDYDTAKEYYEKAFQFAVQNKNNSVQKWSSEAITFIYKIKKDWESAYRQNKVTDSIKDVMNNVKLIEERYKFQTNADIEKQTTIAQLKTAEVEKEKAEADAQRERAEKERAEAETQRAEAEAQRAKVKEESSRVKAAQETAKRLAAENKVEREHMKTLIAEITAASLVILLILLGSTIWYRWRKILADSQKKTAEELQLLAESHSKELELQNEEILAQNEEISVQKESLQIAHTSLETVYSELGVAHKNLKETNRQLESAKNIIEEQKKEIIESIVFSRTYENQLCRITDTRIDDYLDESACLNKPKDIIGGDFRWATKLKFRKKNSTKENPIYSEKILGVVADSTGHGVPAWFASGIARTALEVASKFNQFRNPSDVADFLNMYFYECGHGGDLSLMDQSSYEEEISSIQERVSDKLQQYAFSEDLVYDAVSSHEEKKLEKSSHIDSLSVENKESTNSPLSIQQPISLTEIQERNGSAELKTLFGEGMGMDAIVFTYDKETNIFEYDGGGRPIYIVRKGVPTHSKIHSYYEQDPSLMKDHDPKSFSGFKVFANDSDCVIYELPGKDFHVIKLLTYRDGIGAHRDWKRNTKRIKLQSQDSVYINSDGASHQFGGREGKKLGEMRLLRDVYTPAQESSMSEQVAIIDDFYEIWKQGLDQLDDILISMFRVP